MRSSSVLWTAGLTVTLLALSPAAAEEAFSHEDWTAVLQHFVDDLGRVDYDGLAADRAVFDRYLEAIRSQGPNSRPERFPTREDRLAYYLNAYNALVFDGVLARGPEKVSVWSGTISGLAFFVRMKVRLDGEEMSLKHLEDDLIREQFRDPRVHAALNCASISCPRLPRRAFDPERLDSELDAAMREFVAAPSNCRVDDGDKIVRLSKIFDWFSADFVDYERSQGVARPRVTDYVNRYREADAQIPAGYKIKYFDYDKAVNRQSPNRH
jgi:Protein of unknown function, DUF547